MGIFSRKKSHVSGLLGVDFGAGGLKVVELRKQPGGKLQLGTYGYADFNDSVSRDDLVQDPKQAAEMLKAIIQQSKMEVTVANVSIPSHEVMHVMVTIPAAIKEKAEIEASARMQAAKLLSRPLEEMVLDVTMVDKLEAEIEKPKGISADDVVKDAVEKEKVESPRRVLVSAAPKHLVENYAAIFSVAGLQLKSLETEAFALIRSLVGKDKSRVMIIDMGYQHTSVTIVQDGIPFLHRSIDVGGETVTKHIASSMSVDIAEAEQMKKDLSAGPKSAVPPVLLDAFKPILHEVRFTLELYDQQDFHSYDTVEKIILTGGSAHLPYLDPFLSDALNINIYLGSPWARVQTPARLAPALDEIGPRLAVAVGLAMKQ